MFWHIPDHGFGGVAITRFDDEYHLFTTKTPHDLNFHQRNVHHAVSTDLLHWRDLPDCIGPGAEGAWDGYMLYDLQVIADRGRYYMFYTGLDIPHGRGQRQCVGIAFSDDLISWTRHPGNPVLTADPEYYEQQVPDVATYQEKDRGRMWYRDPWVVMDPATELWTMAIGARAADGNPDLRGCFACATSPDLLNWTSQPPLYWPRRYHTLEVPALFSHGGRWYCFALSHHGWGTPFVTTDPYVNCGGFWAVSDDGVRGPYRTPADEILVGGTYLLEPGGRQAMRAMVFRSFSDHDGQLYASYHFIPRLAPGDEVNDPADTWLTAHREVMPLPKPIRFTPAGDLYLGWPDAYEQLAQPAAQAAPAVDRKLKNFLGRTIELAGEIERDGVISAEVSFTAGLRAGLVLRATDDSDGWCVVLDRGWRCLEFSLLDGTVLDRRRWLPPDASIALDLAVHGPSIEIYIDGKLMMHQARYRETGRRLGVLVEHADAGFSNLRARPWR